MDNWESKMLEKVQWVKDQRVRLGLSTTWLVNTLKHKGCDCTTHKIQDVLSGNIRGGQLDVEIVLYCAQIVLKTYAEWLDT